MRYAIDPTKIHSELGWLPETKFEDGIKKTIKWYLENREWWETIISGEYQNYYEKMYSNGKIINSTTVSYFILNMILIFFLHQDNPYLYIGVIIVVNYCVCMILMRNAWKKQKIRFEIKSVNLKLILYNVKNGISLTLSDNGGVTRGICKMDAENNLTEVVETKNIIKTTEGAEADGVKLDVESLVSMNMWGLTPDFLKTLEEGFKEFFEKEVPANPLKAEYLIPTFIGELLSEGKMSVKVLRTNDTWYGMTYKEDVAAVKESFSKMLENGTYKGDLFSDL